MLCRGIGLVLPLMQPHRTTPSLQTDSANMWIGEIAEGQATTDVQFALPRDFPLAKVVVWNYNRYNCETTGVQNGRLLVGDKQVWSGKIPKGPGTKSKRYGLEIPVAAEALAQGATPAKVAVKTRPQWDDGTALAEKNMPDNSQPATGGAEWPAPANPGNGRGLRDPARAPSRGPQPQSQPEEEKQGFIVESTSLSREASSAAMQTKVEATSPPLPSAPTLSKEQRAEAVAFEGQGFSPEEIRRTFGILQSPVVDCT